MIKTTYINVNYLGNSYMQSFMKNLNQDINQLIYPLNNTSSDIYLGTMKYGFKAVVLRYFDLLRFLIISYYKTPDYDYLNAVQFSEISNIKLF
jgi:hypothetical protein